MDSGTAVYREISLLSAKMDKAHEPQHIPPDSALTRISSSEVGEASFVVPTLVWATALSYKGVVSPSGADINNAACRFQVPDCGVEARREMPISKQVYSNRRHLLMTASDGMS